MLKAISLYSGIGGLDFGFEAAGFETRAALEFDRQACRSLKLNRPFWRVLEEDIHDVTSDAILRQAGLKAGQADVLIGGPPCQPFSKSGYWVRGHALRLDDPRADTLTAYLRMLRDVRPKTFLLENVSGLAYEGKSEGLNFILNGIAKINRETGSKYTPTCQVINTADYGVPQIRERIFVVGSRDGRIFHFPTPTHAKLSASMDDLLVGLQPYRNAWDALGDLPEPSPDDASLKIGGKWGDLLPSIPEGQNYLWHTARGGGQSLFGWRTRYWSFLLKLSKRLPSWTIQAQPGSAIGPFHWTNRRLTFQELCRLQTFPEGLTIDCGRTEMQRMLGNAVPSLIAEIIAREIRGQLLDVPLSDPLHLLPPRRKYIPPPESVRSLPAKYRSYVGTYEAHPGTGKGRVAALRLKHAQQLLVD